MRKLLALLALALGAGAAHADNGRLYVGAGIANDNLRDVTATNSNLNSTNWKVWAGVRPIPFLAVEANYIDLGSQNVTSMFVSGTSSTHLSYKAFTGYAVGYVPLPVPFLDVFGKVGLARWTASGGSTLTGPGAGFFSLSDNGTQFAWGAGGQVHIGNVGARLEYENFSVRNTNGANLVSLSVFLNLF
ncbi:MAG TPA: outer membrane beta-barrel protein [Steroidobacteraceae bacterium]|nr:outer membrane beta-barrel protein [Steroidobacteraceae bacterium]